jgi:acetyl esterase/lipase
VISGNDQQFMQRFVAEFMAPMAQSMSEGPNTPERYRSAMAGLDPWKNETQVPDPELAAYHPAVELRPGLTAAIAVPKGDGPFPVFVIVHGNGLAAGSSQLYRRLTKDIAAGGYVAITPDFRLAPEHPFPAGYDDIVFTLSWAEKHASEYSGDGSRLVLWGDSLGATLAMGVVLGLADEPGAPAVKAVVGAEGFYDFSNPFMAANEVTGWYVGEGGDAVRTDKRVSPLLHIEAGVALPSIFLITGTADFAMGPTLELAKKLNESGIPFQLHVLEGMPHDFMKFPELDGKREGHRLMFDYLSRSV